MPADPCHNPEKASDRNIAGMHFGALPEEILALDPMAFLAGPDREAGDVIIDDIMAKSLEDVCVDLAADWLGDASLAGSVRDMVRRYATNPASYGSVTICEIPAGQMISTMGRVEFHPDGAEAPNGGQEGRMPSGKVIHSSPSPGLVAFSSEPASGGTRRILGLLSGCDLVVKEPYRGKGIGRALVVEALLRNGSLPVWGHDRPSYSRAGAATVLSARRAIISLARRRSMARPPVSEPVAAEHVEVEEHCGLSRSVRRFATFQNRQQPEAQPSVEPGM